MEEKSALLQRKKEGVESLEGLRKQHQDKLTELKRQVNFFPFQDNEQTIN